MIFSHFKEVIKVLVHIPCKRIVVLNHGKGKCPACGKEISVRVSNK